MPWLEATPMEQRERFIRDQQNGLYTMTELCDRHTISRKTGYKWLERFDEGGRAALGDRSRAPQHCPHRMASDVADLICSSPASASELGARKAAAVAGAAASPASRCRRSARPAICWRDEGLVKKRRRRRPSQHPGAVPAMTAHPNDLWTADFKGHFRTQDGVYCYPLTIADQHTRFLIACHGLRSTKGHGVRPVFDRLFRDAWPAACDPHRQWRPVRDHRHSRALPAECVVDAPRHSAPTDPARPAAAEWRARAHAQNAQGRGHSAPARDDGRAATGLQSVSHGVQRGATARILARRERPRLAISRRPARTMPDCRPSSIPGTFS